MAPPTKARQIANRLTENERRVVLLLDEFEEWATAQDLHANRTTLHPLNGMGVIEGVKSAGIAWRWRLSPLGLAVVEVLKQ